MSSFLHNSFLRIIFRLRIITRCCSKIARIPRRRNGHRFLRLKLIFQANIFALGWDIVRIRNIGLFDTVLFGAWSFVNSTRWQDCLLIWKTWILPTVRWIWHQRVLTSRSILPLRTMSLQRWVQILIFVLLVVITSSFYLVSTSRSRIEKIDFVAVSITGVTLMIRLIWMSWSAISPAIHTRYSKLSFFFLIILFENFFFTFWIIVIQIENVVGVENILTVFIANFVYLFII